MTKARQELVLILGVVALAAVSVGCPFNPVIPSARVVCVTSGDCPSGYTCEKVTGAATDVRVCCKEKGCASKLPDASIQIIENAVRDAAVEHKTDGAAGTTGDAPSTDAPAADAPSGDAPSETTGPVCGNGTIEPGETCDPPSTCPRTCPPAGCELYELQGNPDACTSKCARMPDQTMCISNDKCCPTGCTADKDNDCACTCGNGVVEMSCGETCDPLGSCPKTCAPDKCQLKRVANPDTCRAQCVNDTVIMTCTNGDGCCAAGCNANVDNDCAPRCGNGVKEAGEKCDGADCPTICLPVGCQNRMLQGTAGACSAECVNTTTKTTCANGDMCCPPGCNATNDDNCVPGCGNSVIETGEKCDPVSMCQSQSDACVSDNDTIRTRAGTVANCTFACTSMPRPCTAQADGICPMMTCTPCLATCGAGQDLDCKLGNGAACSHGNQCPTGNCVDGVCCTSACGGGCDACTGAGGTCVLRGAGAAGSPSCSPYLCSGSAASCPVTCVGSSGCATGNYCDVANGKCVAYKSNGAACGVGSECISGNCADGVCCNSACLGSCDRCNVGGNSGTCTTAPAGTPGSGAGCNPYLCNGSLTSCPNSCTTSNVCVSGTTCQGGLCQACKVNGDTCTTATANTCCSGSCFNFACQ